MDTRKPLSHSKMPPRTNSRPFLLVVLLATILPGGGHLLLGRMRKGALVLGASCLTLLPLGLAAMLNSGHLEWLALRALTGLYLFGVIDAAWLHFELLDRRDGSGPRTYALCNLLGYGLGYGFLGSWAIGGAAIAGGVLVHGLLGTMGIGWLLLGELLAATAAYHAHRVARENDADARPRPGGGGSAPAWLGMGLAAFAACHLSLLGFSAFAGRELLRSLEVDQSEAVVAEPYYRNADYGVQIELNAPGWTFTETASDEYVRARHISGDAEFSLRSAPRVFGFPDAATMARTALGQGLLEGISLSIVDEGPTRIAGLKGWRIRAQGISGKQAREVEIVAAGRAWRNYVLWYEWGDQNRLFATRELDYLVTHAELSGKRAPVDANLAR